MAEITVCVTNKVGLHARPASQFVQTAKKFKATIRVANLSAGTAPVDAKSILGVLTLGVVQNHSIHIEATGEDADAAIAGLSTLIASNFGEAG